ncbi:hypothetical protein [Kitasatospora cinereorecta]|uniref:Uncharacterized protein n=1 Tax=Kitasatospora cinereorecta TaxID=285560 RepID=A0ABW0VDK3_9ACTN
MGAPNVTDERLAWLLVRDELSRRTEKTPWWSLLRFLHAARGRHGLATQAGGMQQEATSGRMADYALAVDDAAETLSAEERRTLRETSTLPGWFMDDVERRYQEIRRR